MLVCSIDSLTYGDGESIPTSSPCENCICRPPGFACTIISCDYRPGCKAFKRSNQCCPEYQCGKLSFLIFNYLCILMQREIKLCSRIAHCYHNSDELTFLTKCDALT